LVTPDIGASTSGGQIWWVPIISGDTGAGIAP
jgi:hypothetical protein